MWKAIDWWISECVTNTSQTHHNGRTLCRNIVKTGMWKSKFILPNALPHSTYIIYFHILGCYMGDILKKKRPVLQKLRTFWEKNFFYTFGQRFHKTFNNNIQLSSMFYLKGWLFIECSHHYNTITIFFLYLFLYFNTTHYTN